MEVAALIISIISLVTTCIFAFFEIQSNRKLNRINLESVYIMEIYKEYLTISIPQARKNLRFDANNRLIDIGALKNVLIEMCQKSSYYLYADKTFYTTLKTHLQSLEDYIVNNENKSFEPEDQAEVLNNIEKNLGEIYKCINKKYRNG